jgi:dTDP-4-dehydrorhamnose 3,5-epimerase
VNFAETAIPGAYVITLEAIGDDRGWFARTFCTEEFSSRGLEPVVAQCNASFNVRAATLRGMHYQADPHGEAKLVRCSRGAIYDVLVDLRPDSPSYCRWVGIELTPENRRMVYAPIGTAHGFVTLADASEVLYQMSYPYMPDAARGVRFDDPTFRIEWPLAPAIISDRDRSYPDFQA